MPIYEYCCSLCEEITEEFQKLSDPNILPCEYRRPSNPMIAPVICPGIRKRVPSVPTRARVVRGVAFEKVDKAELYKEHFDRSLPLNIDPGEL